MNSMIDRNILLVTLLANRQGLAVTKMNELYHELNNDGQFIFTVMKWIHNNFFYEFKLYITTLEDEEYTKILDYIENYVKQLNINIQHLKFGTKLDEIFHYDRWIGEKQFIIDNTILFDMWINEYRFYGEFIER